MSGVIRILPPEISNRIAAGEVVERPASIVKELIENSIDAGSKRIRIEVEDGGIRKLSVCDDGSGMTADDVRLCFERHSTSKVWKDSDLVSIGTFGFRGEALASIAAVGRVRLRSRHRSCSSGLEVVYENSRRLSETECGMAIGTAVEVDDLFAQVPARRKFLKTPQSEASHVIDTAWHYALAYPEIGMVLINQGRKIFEVSVDKSIEDRFWQLEKRQGSEKLIPIFHEEQKGEGEYIRVEGLIADPSVSHSNSRSIHLYVNRRPVRDRLVLSAVIRAFESMLERGRYPEAYLFISLPLAEVDVNVHPGKQEVRFVRPRDIFDVVLAAVHEALGAIGPKSCEPAGEPLLVPKLGSFTFDVSRRELQRSMEFAVSDSRERSSVVPSRLEATGRHLKVIGQWARSFILCQEIEGSALVVVDQHALHEKLAFLELKEALRKQTADSQQLLFPRRVRLSTRQISLFEENIGEFQKLGFDSELFSDSEILVRAVPGIYRRLSDSTDNNLEQALHDMLDNLGEYGTVDLTNDRVLMTIACHSVVRANEELGMEAMQALVNRIQTPFASRCPHGRPTFFEIPIQMIAREFERSV